MTKSNALKKFFKKFWNIDAEGNSTASVLQNVMDNNEEFPGGGGGSGGGGVNIIEIVLHGTTTGGPETTVTIEELGQYYEDFSKNNKPCYFKITDLQYYGIMIPITAFMYRDVNGVKMASVDGSTIQTNAGSSPSLLDIQLSYSDDNMQINTYNVNLMAVE